MKRLLYYFYYMNSPACFFIHVYSFGTRFIRLLSYYIKYIESWPFGPLIYITPYKCLCCENYIIIMSKLCLNVFFSIRILAVGGFRKIFLKWIMWFGVNYTTSVDRINIFFYISISLPYVSTTKKYKIKKNCLSSDDRFSSRNPVNYLKNITYKMT